MRALVRFLLWVAILGGGLVALLRVTVIRWWRVPVDDPILSASVAPTLRGGDLVLLWRATTPRFGSLVVCPNPEVPGEMVVGRLFGEPGDSVRIEGSDVYVNDDRMETEYACGQATFTVIDPDTGNEVEQDCQIETTGGTSHQRGSISAESGAERMSSRNVGDGKIFLVSDNRQYPYDSRHYGTVDQNACRESVFFRLVSSAGFEDVDTRFTYIR